VLYFLTVMLKRRRRYIFSESFPVASLIRYYCVKHFLAVLSARELLILEHSSEDGEPTCSYLYVCLRAQRGKR